MVLEIADITVKAGSESDFEAGVKKAGPIFQAGPGCLSLELLRTVERPGHYRLCIQWDSIEHHTAFRNSPAAAEWKKLFAQYFEGMPVVEHGERVLKAF